MPCGACAIGNGPITVVIGPAIFVSQFRRRASFHHWGEASGAMPASDPLLMGVPSSAYHAIGRPVNAISFPCTDEVPDDHEQHVSISYSIGGPCRRVSMQGSDGTVFHHGTDCPDQRRLPAALRRRGPDDIRQLPWRPPASGRAGVPICSLLWVISGAGAAWHTGSPLSWLYVAFRSKGRSCSAPFRRRSPERDPRLGSSRWIEALCLATFHPGSLESQSQPGQCRERAWWPGASACA